MFAIAFALLISLGSGASASDVILKPSSDTVSPGETFTVDVYVSPDVAIAGMQFNLEFDDSMLKVEKVEEGDLFKQSGKSTFYYAGYTRNDLLKNVFGCILGRADVSTPGTFTTITMSAAPDAQGTSQLHLTNTIISNPYGRAVDLVITDATIEIVE